MYKNFSITRRHILFLTLFLLMLVVVPNSSFTIAQEPIATETPTELFIPIFTNTPTLEPTATSTETFTSTPTETSTPTPTETATMAASPELTATSTMSLTPTLEVPTIPVGFETLSNATQSSASTPPLMNESQFSGEAMSALVESATSFSNPICTIPTSGFTVIADSQAELTGFIQTANADPTHLYLIYLKPGTYTFYNRQPVYPPHIPQPPIAFWSAMNILGNVIIVGGYGLPSSQQTPDQTVIQRDLALSDDLDLFTVESAGTFTCRSLRLYNVTVKNGGGSDRNSAGNIYNKGVLGLYNTIVENGWVYNRGGGILNAGGYVEAVNTKIRFNFAGAGGGGLYNVVEQGRPGEFYGSCMSFDTNGTNSAGTGGGIWNDAGSGTIIFTKTNFEGNGAGTGGIGGAIYGHPAAAQVIADGNWWGNADGPLTFGAVNSAVGNVSILNPKAGIEPADCIYQIPTTPTPPNSPTATFTFTPTIPPASCTFTLDNGQFHVYPQPQITTPSATVLAGEQVIEVLGLYKNSEGEVWYYLEDYRTDIEVRAWAQLDSTLVAHCTDLILLDRNGNPVPPPPVDDLFDICLFMLPVEADVFNLQNVTDKTNGSTVTPVDHLIVDMPVLVTELHPNRQYVRIRYNNINGDLQPENWIPLKVSGTVVIGETTDCLLDPTHFFDPASLPQCGNGQVVNCRPVISCAWIFGCSSSNQHLHENYVIAGFDANGPGCDNVECEDLPCPQWSITDQRHCGVDLVTQADWDSRSRDDYQNVSNGNRGVYTIAGGIYIGRDPGSGTYQFRTVDTSRNLLLEYQYTHVSANRILDSRRGEFVYAGIYLGEYDDIGQWGSTLHVHTVAVIYTVPTTTDIWHNIGEPVADYYEIPSGIPTSPLPPAPTPTPTLTPTITATP
jgi:hypothetical protein